MIHVLTQKGRGHAPAEQDPIKHMHDTGGVKPGSYTEAFTESLIKAAESRPKWWPSQQPCPTPPDYSPSATGFPSDASTWASPNSMQSRLGPGHGHGWPPSGGRPLRHIPESSLRPGQSGCRPPWAARGVLPGSGGNHRRRRPVPPRGTGHGAAVQGAGHDGASTVVVSGAQQMFDDAMAVTDGPVAIRWSKSPGPPLWPGTGGPRPSRPTGSHRRRERLPTGRREDAGRCIGRRHRTRRRGHRSPVWAPRCTRPLDEACWKTRPTTDWWSP
ncbi:MAG: hypothetical protein Ct9H300mP12_13120 [Acidimicrobiales bacterium]|nr:MAG: hypothetical protein Ct9H300mP12_13120 [Acidimicrobiales bacterium]